MFHEILTILALAPVFTHISQSVPPLWKALQGTWTRLDEDEVFQDDEHVDQKPIGERKAWWELLVEHWQAEVGTMCIV